MHRIHAENGGGVNGGVRKRCIGGSMNREELFAEMGRIVDANVEAYQSDLKIDKETIEEYDRFKAIWLVRDHGTQMVMLTNSIEPGEYIDAVYANMTVRGAYLIERTDEYSIKGALGIRCGILMSFNCKFLSKLPIYVV